MSRFSPFLAALVATLPTFGAKLDYNEDVRPILAENCFYCHGPDGNKRKAKLRLDVREDALKHKAFVPGDAEASDLVKRLFSKDSDEVMPPPDSHRTVTAAQKEILKRWIAEGAEYKPHWAFVAPVRPALPANGEQNPVDAFVVEKLTKAGLTLSPEAPKATLLRRLSLDLIGLPPTPEETAAFLADQSPEAYAKQVDRLMASPHYGERMALPWLDASRYADSNGFQQDGDTFQWVWRDWVVKALNADMPYSQFSIEQLAGDVLEGDHMAVAVGRHLDREREEIAALGIVDDAAALTAKGWKVTTDKAGSVVTVVYVSRNNFLSLAH